jgi:hypothetical protein
MMTLTNFNEELNRVINLGLANVSNAVGSNSVITQAAMATALTNASAAVTALAGSATTHSREIADPGPALNPALPGS